MSVTFRLNGKTVTSNAPGNSTLLEVLRDEFYMVGVKKGCETGECGACTVLIDGENQNACMLLIGEAKGREVTTIEGLAQDGKLDIVQQAFAEKVAVQCGYCTPGMILSVKGLLNRNPNPTRREIQEGLGGNLCRCTGYEQVFEAVEYVLAWREAHGH